MRGCLFFCHAGKARCRGRIAAGHGLLLVPLPLADCCDICKIVSLVQVMQTGVKATTRICIRFVLPWVWCPSGRHRRRRRYRCCRCSRRCRYGRSSSSPSSLYLLSSSPSLSQPSSVQSDTPSLYIVAIFELGVTSQTCQVYIIPSTLSRGAV